MGRGQALWESHVELAEAVCTPGSGRKQFDLSSTGGHINLVPMEGEEGPGRDGKALKTPRNKEGQEMPS